MEKDLKKARRQLKWDRAKEGWLRFGMKLGTYVGKFWMFLLYVLIVAPFRIFARKEPSGWTGKSLDSSLKSAQAQF